MELLNFTAAGVHIMGAPSEGLLHQVLAYGASGNLPPTPSPFDPDPDVPGGGNIEVSFVTTVLTGLVMVFTAVLSRYLGLHLEWRIMIASVRAILQLTILGYVLEPIFRVSSPWPVFALTFVMLLIAASEGEGRLQWGYKGMYYDTVVAMMGGVLVSMAIGILLVVRPSPWWSPSTLVPLWGMILGNALTGVALGLRTTVDAMANRAERDNIEFVLARGGTLWEACRPLAASAVQGGLTPTLNQMSVIGVVAIPGMMTGQILGGATPVQAARYQIIILFLIACSSSIVLIVSVLLTLRALTDNRLCLRPERLTPKAKGDDILIRFIKAIRDAILYVLHLVFIRPVKSIAGLFSKSPQPQEQEAPPAREDGSRNAGLQTPLLKKVVTSG